MPVRVVHLLEAVDVDDDQGDHGGKVVDTVEQRSPIEQAGQLVRAARIEQREMRPADGTRYRPGDGHRDGDGDGP